MFSEASTKTADKLSGGALAGIIVGAICAVVIVALITLVLLRYIKRQAPVTRLSDESEGFENRSYDINHGDYKESSNGFSMRTMSESSS